MLAFMRRFVRSKLGFALFVLLIISFGIFFRDPFSGVFGGGFVQVGDREIRPSDVNRQVDFVLEQYRRETGKVLSQREAAQQGVTQEVLNSEVQRVRAAEFGKRVGVIASESSVTAMIGEAQGFRDSLGRISLDAVKSEAQFRKMSIPEFVGFLRDNRTAYYLQEATDAGLVTPDILLKPLISFNGELRTLSLARVPPANVPAPKTPTDDELRTFYGQNTTRFQQPERRRVSLISYSPADFTDKVQLKDTEIHAEYDRRIKDFSSPETREVIQFTSSDRSKLQDFIDLVKGGATMEDAISKVQGVTRADLTVKPGDLADKQYDQYVFATPPNVLQGPQPLNNVFYAWQVKSVKPGVPQPFEQVADKVREQLAEAEAKRQFEESEESFYDMAGGISLEDISKDIGAPVIQLDAVDNNATTKKRLQSSLLANNPQAVRELFSLSAGQTTDVIEGENQRAIFRVDEIIAPHILPYEEVAADIRQIYMAQKVQEAADKMANDMVAAVKAGLAFDKAAAASKLAALGEVQIIRAANSPIDQNVRAAAFNLAAGETAMVRDSQGGPWVVKVDKVEPASPETEAALRAQIEGDVANSLLNDVREVFGRGMQKAVVTKPNDKALQAYFDNLTKEEAQ